MSIEPSETVTETFLDYLKDNMVKVQSFVDGWPSPNEEMVYPSISIYTKNEKLENHEPREISINDLGENNLEITYSVGQYNFDIQVDIWGAYKAELNDIYKDFTQAFNKQFIENDQPMGLSVILKDYHNQLARYDEIGYSFIEGSDSGQRAEKRMKINLVANFRKILIVQRSKMSTINITQDLLS